MNKLQLTQTIIQDSIYRFQASIPYRAGAALAYRGLFAMAPILFVAMMTVGIVFGQQIAKNEVTEVLERIIGVESVQFLEAIVVATAGKTWSNRTLLTLISIGILLYAATNMFRELKIALNSLWGIQPEPKIRIMSDINGRLLGVAMVFLVGFLFLALTIINVILTALGSFLPVDDNLLLFQGLGAATSLALLTVLFAVVFKYTPDVALNWRDVWVGSTITSLMFIIGVWALGIYFSFSSFDMIYGTAEALIITLIWIYFIAQVFLAGAAFTYAYASNVGSHKKSD